MKVLRPYQQAAIDATLRQLEQWGSTVVVLPTGMGKTVYASRLISTWERGNTLFLAHTRELIHQAADKLSSELGYRPPIEMGVSAVELDTMYSGEMCVVASVQTMYGDKRLEKYRRHPFGLIVVDECFPAGTLVDGRPIESFQIGDQVAAFDPVSGRTTTRAVRWVFKNQAPPTLFTIHAGGRAVTATANHPFHTGRGWVNACDIQVGDDVYGLFDGIHGAARPTADEVQSGGNATVLHPAMLHSVETPDASDRVRDVWGGVRADQPVVPCPVSRPDAGLLFDPVRACRDDGALCGNDGGDEPQTRVGTDEGTEPDASGRVTGEGVSHTQGHGARSAGEGWERARDDGPGTDALGRGGAVPVHPAGGAHRGVPDALQTRPCGPDGETGHRVGRAESRRTGGEGGGRTQDGLLGVARVDRVEVHQRGGYGRYGEVCPDGRVYNLEVEGEHTYLANGFAVHNCHHATAATYRKVIDFFRSLNPSLKVVGITATPNRADGAALGIVFESEAYQMSIGDAIHQGWLVPIEQEYVVCDQINYDGIRTKKNEFGEADFSGAALEDVMKEEEAVHAVARPLVEKTGDRPTLVFCAGVEHAHIMAAVLNRYKPESARAVDGKTDPLERKKCVADFQAGRLQYLTNCMVFTEGFDAPNCSVVAMARPTKSLSMYMQMLGRGLRPLPGVVDGIPEDFDRRMSILTSAKPSCYVLDFVGNSNHKLANVFDVLGGNYDVAVRELARQEAARQKKPVSEVLEQAKALLELERQWAEREHVLANASYSAFAVDPFGDGAAPSVQTASKGRGGSSDAQIGLLVKLGIDYATAAGYSKRQAGAVIDQMSATRCTVGQARALRKNGIDPNGIGLDRAGRILDALAKNGWRQLKELPE